MNKVELPVFNGDVTEPQIAAWKSKYRKVIEVEIEDCEEVHKAYFRRPNMEELAAIVKVAKSDEMKSADILFKNCWLGGSQTIQEEAVMKIAVVGNLKSLLSVDKSSIKNL